MGRCLSRRLTLFVLSVVASLVFAVSTQSTQISGTIDSTLTIVEDSELVGDVSCGVVGGACIMIAAPHVSLRLNGHTLAGTIAGCTLGTASDDGVDVIAEQDVAIVGPGLIEGFGGFGIFLKGDTKARVKRVTISDNCFSGIILVGTTDSDIERNVSVRNSKGSENGPCGGT